MDPSSWTEFVPVYGATRPTPTNAGSGTNADIQYYARVCTRCADVTSFTEAKGGSPTPPAISALGTKPEHRARQGRSRGAGRALKEESQGPSPCPPEQIFLPPTHHDSTNA